MKESIYGIEQIEVNLSKKMITSSMLAEEFDFDLGFIEEKIGVKKLYISDGETTSDLAVQVMDKLLLARPNLREELDLLIVCTQTPDFQLPHVSALVHARTNLHNGVAAFDISLGCSGFVYGLSVIEALMTQNNWENAVLITSETYSSIIDPKDRSTKCLFSDAAVATLITRAGSTKIGRFCFGSKGHGYDSLIVRPALNGVGKQPLFMDGRAIYEFAVSTIPGNIVRTCEINNLDLHSVDYFVLHQASKFVLDAIGRKLKIDNPSKLINFMAIAGNTVSSSIPMALKETLSMHPGPNLKIIISGFGVGLSWASTLLST
jgi:3-oxoacyl-[acyl-carrier-protein] synthase III